MGTLSCSILFQCRIKALFKKSLQSADDIVHLFNYVIDKYIDSIKICFQF